MFEKLLHALKIQVCVLKLELGTYYTVLVGIKTSGLAPSDKWLEVCLNYNGIHEWAGCLRLNQAKISPS
jgi:hypothetical protein